MSLPTLAAVALVATMLSQSQKAKCAATVKSQTPGGHHTDRPTGPSQMHVDPPQRTALRNDAVGETPAEIDAYLRGTYAREACSHPGVQSVAGKAAA